LIDYLDLLLYGNIVLLGLVYIYLFKIRKLIGFQLGMNISMMAGGFLAIATGVILIYQFPLYFVPVTFVTTVVGMLVGSLFGALFDYQTLLTGYANGLMMGIMAPMVGAAAENSIVFLVFIEIVFIVSLILLMSSAKHS
jgi:ABC-type Na+ efflux pump permease subunit